jgi:hypothetical protein
MALFGVKGDHYREIEGKSLFRNFCDKLNEAISTTSSNNFIYENPDN